LLAPNNWKPRTDLASTAVADTLDALEAKRPAGHHLEEVEAMIDAVPDAASYRSGDGRGACRDPPGAASCLPS